MEKPKSPPPIREVRTPRFVAPPGSCDCHVHIVGPQELYPLAPEATIEIDDSTFEDFKKAQAALGMTRAVIVGFGHYAYKYQPVLHALARDPVNFRGVIIIPPDITDRELRTLSEAGVVGARFYPGLAPPDGRILARIREIGWSAHFAFANTAQLDDWLPVVDAYDGRIVIDHVGLPPVDQGLDSPHFRKIVRLVDSGRCWIKLSHRFSKLPHPPFEDTLPFLHALIERRPDRMLFGSDYPHPSYWTNMPNEADLLDLMLTWVPSEEVRRQIMVRNPEELFGFEPFGGA